MQHTTHLFYKLTVHLMVSIWIYTVRIRLNGLLCVCFCCWFFSKTHTWCMIVLLVFTSTCIVFEIDCVPIISSKVAYIYFLFLFYFRCAVLVFIGLRNCSGCYGKWKVRFNDPFCHNEYIINTWKRFLTLNLPRATFVTCQAQQKTQSQLYNNLFKTKLQVDIKNKYLML